MVRELERIHRRDGNVVAESVGSVSLPYPAEFLRSTPDPEPLRQVAVVTGGATGLGRSVALEFGKMGCKVAFCFVDMPGRDVRETALLTETTLSAMGVAVYADCCDVRDRGSVDRFFAEVRNRFETVHFLVNNAGVANDGAHWRLTPAEWNDVLETNLTGAFNCMHAVLPQMRERRDGFDGAEASLDVARPLLDARRRGRKLRFLADEEVSKTVLRRRHRGQRDAVQRRLPLSGGSVDSRRPGDADPVRRRGAGRTPCRCCWR